MNNVGSTTLLHPVFNNLEQVIVFRRVSVFYYMDSGILLGTKTLVELIRHYIRDTVRVFSVCHA